MLSFLTGPSYHGSYTAYNMQILLGKLRILGGTWELGIVFSSPFTTK